MVEGKGFVEPGPLALNEVLDSSPGDYSRPSAKACSGGGIILGSAVPDASGGSLKWNRSDAGSTSTETLDNNLCSPTPTPVLVVVKNPTSGHDHYVVVTGKTSTGYSIIDPGYLGRTDLSSHG